MCAGAPGLAGLLAELEWRGILQATTPGLPARLALGTSISRIHRLRPDGGLAACRASHPDLRSAATPTVRWSARGAPRWRDGDDRRSVGPLDRAEPAGPGDAGSQRRPHRRPAGTVPGLHPRIPGRSSSTTSIGSASCRWSSSFETRASTSRCRTCSPRTRCRSASSAVSRSPSSATCCSSRMTSRTCIGRWASSCRWVARTSGATSPPVWS